MRFHSFFLIILVAHQVLCNESFEEFKSFFNDKFGELTEKLEIYNLKNEIFKDNVRQDILELKKQLSHELQCPSGSKYKVIEGICIYFETQKLNFAKASANCKTKFGNGNGGRLFEPKSLHMNQLVYEASVDVGFSPRWIGVNDLSSV